MLVTHKQQRQSKLQKAKTWGRRSQFGSCTKQARCQVRGYLSADVPKLDHLNPTRWLMHYAVCTGSNAQDLDLALVHILLMHSFIKREFLRCVSKKRARNASAFQMPRAITGMSSRHISWHGHNRAQNTARRVNV